MPIIDLDEWAESRFASLCAEAGVARNKAVQDRTGWDYLIEFPATVLPGVPADLQPLGPSARVQVKSKRKGPPSVKLKLTNALRFAKSTDPCFVVLFVEGEDGSPDRVYAHHFWERFTAATLERARSAGAPERPPLHRQTLGLAFTPEDDHTDDLLAWMRAEIAAVGGLYAQKKALIAQTVGMEDGGIHGVLSFEAIDWIQLVDHQLGLTPHFPVVKMTLNQRRFGVDTPIISLAAPDTATMRPHPHPCKVRVRGADRSEVWLDGEVLAPSFPDLPPEHFRYRLRADILDLIVDPNADGQKQTAKASSMAEDQLSLEALGRRLALVRMLARGPIKLQMRMEGRIMLDAACVIDAGQQFAWADRIALAVEMLSMLAAGDIPPTLTLSVADIEMAWPALVDLNGLVRGADLNFRARLGIHESGRLEGCTLWAWGHAEIGAWSFMAVVSRPIRRLVHTDTDLEIQCGDPDIADGLVRPVSDASHRDDLRRAHQRAVALSSEDPIVLFDGDYRTLLNLCAPKDGEPAPDARKA